MKALSATTRARRDPVSAVREFMQGLLRICERSWQLKSVFFASAVFSMGIVAPAAAEQTTSSSAIAPAMTVKWLPACSGKDAEPFFSLDVFDDGTVRYEGGQQTRERGERRTHLEPQALKALVDSAKRAESGSSRSAYRKSKEDAPQYCLEVVRREKGRTHSTRAVASQMRVRNLVAALDEVVTANHWVCPARVSPEVAPDHALKRAMICNDGKDLAIDFGETDALGCMTHQIEIYKDAVHYYVLKLRVRNGKIGLPHTLVTEEFRAITGPEFDRLLNMVRGLNLHQEEMSAGPTEVELSGNRNHYFTSDKTDVQRVKDIVQQIAMLNWFELPSGAQRCSAFGGSATLLLRYDYGPPTSKQD